MPEHAQDDQSRPLPAGGADREMDAAAQSLADALRWSFRLLSAIMILVLVGFVLSGFKTIQPQQMGVKKVFGCVTGVVDQGLAFTWPFPIGEIQIVDISEQAIEIDDFWMHETPEDKTKLLGERTAMSEGLRPGWDGALFTGDKNLLHVKLSCRYRIQDVLGYLRAVQETNLKRQTALRELIRSLVCKAAVQVASSKTADSIRYSDKEQYTRQVRAQTQRQLNRLTLDPARIVRLRGDLAALRAKVDDKLRQAVARDVDKLLGHLDAGRIGDARAELGELAKVLQEDPNYDDLWRQGTGLTESVKILRIAFIQESWPLKARDAYVSAQRARSERENRISQAIANAKAALSGAAGDSYEKLVGKPWEIGGRSPQEAAAEDLIGQWRVAVAAGDEKAARGLLKKIDFDLIGQYEAARDSEDNKKADWLLARIDEVLGGKGTEGKAFRILAAAKARGDAALQPLLAWKQRFEKVLPAYRAAPRVFLTREWAAAATEIFEYPTTEKYMMNPGTERTILRINRPPEIRKSTLDAGLKKDKDK